MTLTRPEPDPAAPPCGTWPLLTEPCKRRKAVRWLSPGQLLTTGLEVAASAYFARFADKRELEATVPRVAYDMSATPADEQSPFVLDYVADTGDGFNSTYAVACSVTRATEVVLAPDPTKHRVLDGCTCQAPLESPTAGNLLAFGGDEVYPVAQVTDYDERFKDVYRVAADAGRTPDPAPRVVAIPGNHDWYDGLVSFRRNFCESWTHEDPYRDNPGCTCGCEAPTAFVAPPADIEQAEGIAAWETFQSRSYFAVKLPHHWWLWGIDNQLDAFIDAEQLDYFRRAADELFADPEARLILAVARPTWCDDPGQDDPSDLSNHQNLTWFIRRKLGDEWATRLRLVVTGDKHHYVRYHRGQLDLDALADALDNTGQGPEFVTCGGGGAYLSSTHKLPRTVLPLRTFKKTPDVAKTEYTMCRAFPTPSESVGLRWRALLTPFRNPGLVPFVGVLYAVLLLALASSMPTGGGWLPGRLPGYGDYHWGVPSLSDIARVSPVMVATGVLLAVLLAFAGLGSGGRQLAGRVAGLGHWGVHLGVLSVASQTVREVSRWLERRASSGWSDLAVDGAAVLMLVLFVLAFGLLGALVMGLYLWACDHFHVHENEVFAAFRYEGYKSHLRIHVAKDGLHVRAIGLRDVPKKWTGRHLHDLDQPGSCREVWLPRGREAVASEEIDAFVVRR